MLLYIDFFEFFIVSEEEAGTTVDQIIISTEIVPIMHTVAEITTVLDMELVDLIMAIMAVVYLVIITAKPAGFLVGAEIHLLLGQVLASWAGPWQEWPQCLCTIDTECTKV